VWRRRPYQAALLFGVLLASPVAAQEQAADFVLPAGAHREIVQQHCVQCHYLGRVVKIGATHDEWLDRIGRMIRYGSTIPRDQVVLAADYLTQIAPAGVNRGAINSAEQLAWRREALEAAEAFRISQARKLRERISLAGLAAVAALIAIIAIFRARSERASASDDIAAGGQG
jgi:hypothetical protein